MVEAPFDTHELLAVDLAADLAGVASVTEQSDGWVRFDLAGLACHDVLERLCNADTRGMAKGASTRTSIEHLGCFLVCRGDNEFSMTGPRSSAQSLHHAITTAMISVS
jgi:sarcosine oxidase subunit gamma